MPQHGLRDHGYRALDGLDTAYYAIYDEFLPFFSEYFMTWA